MFPKKDELPIYGKDVPVPTSFDELKCEYREKEPVPPLKLEELEGYAVPPEGIVCVYVNGVGAKKSFPQVVYGPGTFREDRHSIDKALGVSHNDIVLAREQQRRDSFDSGIIKMLEEKNILEADVLEDRSSQVIEGLAYWAATMVDDKQSSRDAVAFLKLYLEKIQHKDEVIKNIKGRSNLSVEDALKVASHIAKEIEDRRKGEVIEVEAYDVGGEG